MAEVKWIQITTDIFENRKIKQIEVLPEGDTIIVIWFKLLALAGNINDNGLVYFTKDLPYTDQMLATYFNRPLATVQMAIDIFQKFEMINIVDNLLEVSNWEKYQNIEGLEKIREQTRKRVARHRELKKLECNVTSNVTVTQGNAIDIDIDKDIDIYKEKESKKKATAKRFTPPSVDEVRAYCKERNNSIDAERFVDFYTSKGWKVGNNPMKDWKAAVRTWEKRDNNPTPSAPQKKADDGIMIYSIDEADENPPYYGLPEEWFDNENLIMSRITKIKQPAIRSRGIYEDVIYTEKEVYEKYLLRKQWFDEEGAEYDNT